MEIVYYWIQTINDVLALFYLALFNWHLEFKRQREAHANYHLFHFMNETLNEKKGMLKRYATTYWNAWALI